VRDSADFASKFAANEIWDGSAYTNGWDFSSNPALTLNPDYTLTFANDNADWLEGRNSTVDGGATTWDTSNHLDWTLEVRLKFNALPNGVAFWLGAATDIVIVDVFDTYTQDSGGGTFTTEHAANLDGEYHTYRFANDSTNNRYYVWRDGTLLTPTDGVAYDSPNNDDRLIIGDRTEGSFANNFNITIDHVRYDQTGAYAPRIVVDNLPGATDVTASSATLNGNLIVTSAVPTVATVFWGATDGRTDPAAWQNTNTFGSVSVGPLSTNVNVAEGTTYYYRFHASNAVETAWAPTTAEFAAPFGQVVSLAVTDHASEEGPDTGTFTFTRTKTGGELTVSYAIAESSTAREGSDYTALAPHTATFAGGQSNTLVTVTPLPDGFLYEGTETVDLVLQPGTNYSLGTATASMNITSDADSPGWPFAATDIEGSRLWLDASDVDADGQDDNLSDGAAVATWADKSGFANHATQATADLRPVVKTGVLSGKPVVRFDGADDRLLSGTTSTYRFLHDGSGATFFIVWRLNATTEGDLQWAIDTGGGSSSIAGVSYGTENRGTDTDRLWFHCGNAGLSGNVLTTEFAQYDGVHPDQTWMMGTYTFQNGLPGDDVWYGTNGAMVVSQEPQGPAFDGPSARVLGIGATSGSAFPLNGDIAEIVFYDKVLNSNELNHVGAYLEVKYGLDTTYDPGVTLVQPRPATNVTTTSAFLNGELVYEDATPTTVKTFWGETDGGTDAAAWANTNSFGEVPVGMLATNVALSPNTRYYFRFYATNSNGAVWADTSESFITGEITIQATDPDAAELPEDEGSVTVFRPPIFTNETMTVQLGYTGSATRDTDYAGGISEVTFAPGESEKVVTLTPIHDWVGGEGAETVVVTVLADGYVASPTPATVTIADSAPRTVKRSASFAYRYECDTAHPQDEDLNGDTNSDWDFSNAIRPTPWPDAPTGTVSNGVDLTHSTQPLTSIWNTESFDGDYTLECRVRTISQNNTKAFLGAMTIWATPAGPDLDTCMLYVGTNALHFGQNGAYFLGNYDNTTEFHTYRVVRRKPANSGAHFWLWRDGELLNPSGEPLPNTFNEPQGRDMILLGDTSISMQGQWELDYVRLEKGAWGWAPPAAPGMVIIVK